MGPCPRVDRDLIALTGGGHAFVTDSAKGGIAGYQPFSDGRGAWRCLGSDGGKFKLKIIVFDFTTTPDAETNRYMARITTQAETDPSDNTIAGNSLVEFLTIDANPYTAKTERPSIPYEFTGVRLTVPE